MPEYLSPGVYVEEVDAGPKPIEGVSTSTAGAVGVTVRGPTSGKPELVTSFADFARKFGGVLEVPDAAIVNKWTDPTLGGRWWYFPLAVKGFFDNGGQRLYVKRVFTATAVASSGNVGKGMIAEVVADAAAGTAKVKLGHLINIAEGTVVQLFRGDDGIQIGANFTVNSYEPSSGYVTLDVNLPEALMAKRGDLVQIHARSVSPVPVGEVSLTFSAKSRGKWGDDMRVQVRPTVAATLSILHDPNIPGDANTSAVVSTSVAAMVWTIEVDDVTGLANNDHVTVMGNEYAIANLDAVAKTFTITPGIPAGEVWAAGTIVKRLRAANTAGASNKINVWGAARIYEGAIVELDNGGSKETFTVTSRNGDTLTLSANLGNAYFEGHRMRLIEAEVTAQYVRNGEVETEELFGPLRLKDDGSASYLVTHINERSDLVEVVTGAGFSESDLSKFPTPPTGHWVQLSGGDDKLNDLSVDDFVGEDKGSGARTGVQALEDIDEISICLSPGIWAGPLHSALIQHCELLKDRFAIIDPQDGLDIEGIRTFREPFDTKYAALYYPWLDVRDPVAKRNVVVGPSAHMAGIYARVDVERGVHKAPANEVIRGINEIAQDVTKREQDMLNPKNINVLRFFPGRGNRVWGARVVTSDSAWKYINVRRLFIFVEESIQEGTQWVVFEPNDEPLWARVRQSITNFLTTVWRSGALQGLSAEEAFFVKCDRSTMTQDDIDNGRLICIIGIAPVKPAEFVIFRIQQKTLDNVGS